MEKVSSEVTRNVGEMTGVGRRTWHKWWKKRKECENEEPSEKPLCGLSLDGCKVAAGAREVTAEPPVAAGTHEVEVPIEVMAALLL